MNSNPLGANDLFVIKVSEKKLKLELFLLVWIAFTYLLYQNLILSNFCFIYQAPKMLRKSDIFIFKIDLHFVILLVGQNRSVTFSNIRSKFRAKCYKIRFSYLKKLVGVPFMPKN